ncbi:MTAP family purine nucleoside phosphorylase [Candidatus Micrarchaeota archaeon]|nr:MTAP family purine nucleoside phosphorylase [Candidatus Micrarchaeota archaeon]
MNTMLGIIAGTGFAKLLKGEERTVPTPHGNALVKMISVNGKEIAFLPRHGLSHSIPPHKINYKANISALHLLGVNNIFATYACGVIDKYDPGDIIILDDVIALDKLITFFDDFSKGIKHTDMTEPYSKSLGAVIEKASKKVSIPVKKDGIITTTFGPRYETRSEIKALKFLGANLVNMTSAYEVVLARELGINFAGVAVGTNYACGISKNPLTHEEVEAMMKEKENELRTLLLEASSILED